MEEAAIHKNRDNLNLKLLSDAQLAVIRQYGVEHHKAIGFTTGTVMLGGIPLALTPSFKTMAETAKTSTRLQTWRTTPGMAR